jgi:UDP-N-acetylmuramate--alanine ligase
MTGRHLHLMGIGGVGMCGLAEVLAADGAVVTGCDLAASERTERLESRGVEVAIRHDPAHLDGAEALVVSAAVRPNEPERLRARELGLPVVRRAELLAELMRGRRGVAVSGTHGKTTTTALIGHLLSAVGLDPTVVVGGHARFLDGHGRRGAGELMVCEADEFDRAFLELGPEIAVVTNLEAEHMDCYTDAEDLRRAFVAFTNRVAAFGAVIACVDDAGARSVIPDARRRVVRYGLGDDAELRAADVETRPDGSTFVVRRAGEKLGTVRVSQPGEHLIRNTLAAVAVGLEVGVPFADLAAACASFDGVGRRFERRGDRDGVTVIDDYAHHPTELRAVLAAARQAFPGRRVVAVFQPHLYSRTRDFADEFGRALTGADVAVVLPVYAAREAPVDGVDAALVVAAARVAGHPSASEGPGVRDAATALDAIVGPGDVVLTLGAGDVWRVADMWLARGAG